MATHKDSAAKLCPDWAKRKKHGCMIFFKPGSSFGGKLRWLICKRVSLFRSFGISRNVFAWKTNGEQPHSFSTRLHVSPLPTTGDTLVRRFIHRLKPGTKLHRQWTSPMYYVFILLYGKVIITASKRYFSFVVPQVDGGVFPTFLAKRQRIKKRQIVQKNKTASRWKKMLMFQNALVKITRSSHSLSTTYLRLLPSGSYGWFFSSLVNVQNFSQLSETVLPTERNPLVHIW